MKFRKGVFVVVYRKKKNKILYLLLKRKLHWSGWEFPKGGLEKNEKINRAVLREVKEETGHSPTRVKKYSVSGKYKYAKEHADRKGICGQTYNLYSAEITDKKIKIDKRESSKYKWLNFEKAIKLLTWPNQRKCLRIVNKALLE